jgi:hypothetical protein
MRAALTIALALSLFAATSAAADPPRERSDRESRFSREEIDEAIADAEDSADEFAEEMDEIVEDGPQDARKREDLLRTEVDELVHALDRLREHFDADDPWADQRAEARLAYTQWKKLDPKVRHHWASEARDEFRELHRDLRRLARIYEVDSPPRR